MGRFLRISNGVARSFDESSSLTIYDQSYTAGGVGLAANTPITLPSSQTYDSSELEVYVNGQRADVVLDYNYVGIVPRTQITLTFPLNAGEVVRFRIDRAA